MSYSSCACAQGFYNGPLNTLATSNVNSCTASNFVLFMTILETLLLNSCWINDPCGRVVPKITPDDEYDFIVIGGGSSGSVVTGRLAEENGWKILLIEAGHDEPAFAQLPIFHNYALGSTIDWNFTTDSEPIGCQGSVDQKCSWPRGKVLGGSGVLNNMIYMRMTEKDSERWVDAGNTDWTHDEMLRLYAKSEDNLDIGTFVSEKHHSRGGPWTIKRFSYDTPDSPYILKAAEEVGYGAVEDLNGDINHGFARFQVNSRDGMRLSPAKAFLRPHRNNSNLHIMLNSTVTKILIEENYGTKRAYGVQFNYNDVTYTVNAAKEVILAAGAIQTPQILLLSGIGDKPQLDSVGIKQVHDLPAVGQGLQDHPSIYLYYSTNKNSTLLSWGAVDDYLSTKSGPLSALLQHDTIGRLSSSYSTPDDPDGEILSNSNETLCETPSAKIMTIAVILNQPRSKGYIALRSNNVLDSPKIVANYFTNETDLKIMVELIRLTQRLTASSALQDHLAPQLINQTYYETCSSQFTYDSDSFWECAVKYGTATMYHPSSSCKMGPSTDPEACVNQQLQLYGIKNIRITDASVLPTCPSCNLQATIVAMAEKTAEVIKEKYLGYY